MKKARGPRPPPPPPSKIRFTLSIYRVESNPVGDFFLSNSITPQDNQVKFSNFNFTPLINMLHTLPILITHLAGQTYVWHGGKWNFAGPQIYFQPAKIKSQLFAVSFEFLVCN